MSKIVIRKNLLWIGAVVALLASCQSAAPGTPIPDILDEINATLQPNVIVLQPGDSVIVSSPTNTKVNQTAQVRPDGRATFQYIGELDVTGMTVAELTETLKRLYTGEIVAPDLLVRAGSLASRSVIFMGAVAGAVLPIAPEMTMDLIEAMGRQGIPRNTFATIQHLVLIRWMPDEGRRRHWIIDARSEYWTNPELLFLQPGDIVYVPEHPIVAASQWIRQAVQLIPLPYIFQITN